MESIIFLNTHITRIHPDAFNNQQKKVKNKTNKTSFTQLFIKM